MIFKVKVIGFCLLCLIMIVSPALAEEFECAPNVSSLKEFKDIVGKVQKAYQKVDSFEAKFRQTSFLAALEITETSSGDVTFLKPARMKWYYEFPEPQIFIVKDETLWHYQEIDRQLAIQELGAVLISDLPVGFLMGIGDLARDFELLAACRQKENIVLNLTPKKDSQGGLKTLYLMVSKQDFLPRGAKIIDYSDNQTAFLFSSMKFNTDIAVKDFDFQAPPGTDINDQRPVGTKGISEKTL